MRPFPRLLYYACRLYWYVSRPLMVGVRLILERDRAVLLVKHTYRRHWYLSGGGVKRGETLEQAARREAAEELGATLGDLRLFGVYSNLAEYKSDHVVVFSCRDISSTGKMDREIERFGFFGFDDLPKGTSSGSMRRIHEYANGTALPIVGAW